MLGGMVTDGDQAQHGNGQRCSCPTHCLTHKLCSAFSLSERGPDSRCLFNDTPSQAWTTMLYNAPSPPHTPRNCSGAPVLANSATSPLPGLIRGARAAGPGGVDAAAPPPGTTPPSSQGPRLLGIGETEGGAPRPGRWGGRGSRRPQTFVSDRAPSCHPGQPAPATMASGVEVLRFQLPGHEAATLRNMNQLRAEERFCDVTIVADSLKFRGHKVILAACSPFLRDQFLLNPSSELQVSLMHSARIVADLLLSCYTGALEFAVRDIVNYLTAASYLQMEHVVEKCRNALSQFIEPKIGLKEDGGGVGEASLNIKCTKCPEVFQGVEKLVFHMRAQHFIFMCPRCGKQFNHSSNLNRHMNVHRGVKSHSCGICGKCFTQKSTLHDHLNLHSGARPYRCSYCDVRFAHKPAIRRHLKEQHGKTTAENVLEAGVAEINVLIR
ncbi:zinc finger and BTB domain containing 12 [Cricetulus griseus]